MFGLHGHSLEWFFHDNQIEKNLNKWIDIIGDSEQYQILLPIEYVNGAPEDMETSLNGGPVPVTRAIPIWEDAKIFHFDSVYSTGKGDRFVNT